DLRPLVAAAGLLFGFGEARAKLRLVFAPRRPFFPERAHAALQLLRLARLVGAAVLGLLDLLVAITPAALMAVDGQRPLPEPSAIAAACSRPDSSASLADSARDCSCRSRKRRPKSTRCTATISSRRTR